MATTVNSLPGFVQPYAQGYLQRAQQTADMPFQAYGGPRVAEFNPLQKQGLDAMANRAAQGAPVLQQAQSTLGQFFANPQQSAAQNQYAQFSAPTQNTAQITPGTNPYMGASNPYLQQQIDAAQGDVIRNWNTVQAPQFDAAMARSGSFGNSGIAEFANLGGADLQRNLARIASDMRMGDYTQQIGLQENNANRSLQAQQLNANLISSNLDRGLQAEQARANLGEQMAGRQDAVSSANQARILQALGMAPVMAAADYTDIDRLLQAGTAAQLQEQRMIDADLAQFTEAQNYPLRQLDIMGNALGRSYGGVSTQEQDSPNRVSQALGGALTFAQLAKLLGIGG